LLICVLAPLVPSCFAVTDLDRFHAADGSGGSAPVDDPGVAWDLVLTMKGMGVHLNQLIEFRVVDSENYVQSRGVIEPMNQLAVESVTFTLPKAIPVGNRPYRLDFYADVNESEDFDGLDTGITHDHAWRVEPLQDFPEGRFPHVANEVQVVFTHNTVFTDIREWPGGTVNLPKDVGLGVLIQFPAENMAEFVGKMCQVRVLEARSGHTVGLYRNPEIPANDFRALVAGIVEAGESYDIDIYIDANGNGVYDNPQSDAPDPDLGWRFSETARFPDSGAGGAGGEPSTAEASVGIEFTFDPKARPGVQDVGEP
jgi:hypothetical protein